jgi:hypothetical protein
MESMGRAQSLLRDMIIQCDWIFEEEVVAEEEVKETVESVSGAGPPEETATEIPVGTTSSLSD